MEIKEKVVDHFAEIFKYGQPSKLKEIIKDNVGRFYQYQETTEFLKNNQVEEVDSLSKKERNILADSLQNNARSSFIVTQYNDCLKNRHVKLEEKEELFKAIKTTSEFLKVSPYKEDVNFQQMVYEALISFHFNHEKENKKLLQKSFNLFLDKPTIKGFLGKDSLTKKESIKQIEQKIKIEELESHENTVVISIAGLVGSSMLVMTDTVSEQINNVSPKIVSMTSHVHNAILANGLANVAVMGVIMFTAYQSIKTFSEVCEKMSENNKEERIGYIKTKDLNSHVQIASRLFYDALHNNKLDLNDKENQNYIDLSLYLQEKLNNKKCAIPPELKVNLKLNDAQVKKLQALSVDEIHELANIANPQARMALLLNEYDPHEKALMKQIINAKTIYEFNNDKEHYFKPTEIKDLGHYLENKIIQLPNKDQALINQYLDLFVSKEGYLNHTVKTELEYALKNNQNLVSTINNQLDIKIANKLKEPEKNQVLAYAKKTAAWFTGKGTDKIVSINLDVLNYLNKKEVEFNFTHLESVLSKKPTLGEKLDSKGSDLIRKIGSIRDKVFSINKTQNTHTI